MKQRIQKGKKYIILFILLLFIFSFIPSIGNAFGTIQQQIGLMTEIYEIITTYHVSNINPEKVTQGAINGMIGALDDPYTTYFTEAEYNQFLQDIDHSFTGIGIYIEEKDGYIMVQSAIPNSPAAFSGLQTGDYIIAVDGLDIYNKTLEEVSSLIRGIEGTSVTLTIKREGTILTKEIIRGKINLPIVEARMLNNKIGYIRLYTFSSQSALEFKKKLNNLKAQGLEELVLDLRGNPGGYLDAALDISKNFIQEGPIIYVRNKNQEEQAVEIVGGTYWDAPMVVLIDKGSASASEVLAGALRDYKKAIIVGQTSFGKGSVQNTARLENGGYLKITLNEYFTPNKTKINGIGLKPDVEELQADKQLEAAINSLNINNEMNKSFEALLGTTWVKANNKNYVALRALAQAFEGKVFYDSLNKTISLTIDNETKTYSSNKEGIFVQRGVSYISIELLKQDYKQLIIVEDSAKITIYNK